MLKYTDYRRKLLREAVRDRVTPTRAVRELFDLLRFDLLEACQLNAVLTEQNVFDKFFIEKFIEEDRKVTSGGLNEVLWHWGQNFCNLLISEAAPDAAAIEAVQEKIFQAADKADPEHPPAVMDFVLTPKDANERGKLLNAVIARALEQSGGDVAKAAENLLAGKFDRNIKAGGGLPAAKPTPDKKPIAKTPAAKSAATTATPADPSAWKAKVDGLIQALDSDINRILLTARAPAAVADKETTGTTASTPSAGGTAASAGGTTASAGGTTASAGGTTASAGGIEPAGRASSSTTGMSPADLARMGTGSVDVSASGIQPVSSNGPMSAGQRPKVGDYQPAPYGSFRAYNKEGKPSLGAGFKNMFWRATRGLRRAWHGDPTREQFELILPVINENHEEISRILAQFKKDLESLLFDSPESLWQTLQAGAAGTPEVADRSVTPTTPAVVPPKAAAKIIDDAEEEAEDDGVDEDDAAQEAVVQIKAAKQVLADQGSGKSPSVTGGVPPTKSGAAVGGEKKVWEPQELMPEVEGNLKKIGVPDALAAQGAAMAGILMRNAEELQKPQSKEDAIKFLEKQIYDDVLGSHYSGLARSLKAQPDDAEAQAKFAAFGKVMETMFKRLAGTGVKAPAEFAGGVAPKPSSPPAAQAPDVAQPQVWTLDKALEHGRKAVDGWGDVEDQALKAAFPKLPEPQKPRTWEELINALPIDEEGGETPPTEAPSDEGGEEQPQAWTLDKALEHGRKAVDGWGDVEEQALKAAFPKLPEPQKPRTWEELINDLPMDEEGGETPEEPNVEGGEEQPQAWTLDKALEHGRKAVDGWGDVEEQALKAAFPKLPEPQKPRTWDELINDLPIDEEAAG